MHFSKLALGTALFFSLPLVAHAEDIESGFIKKNAYETDHFRIEFSDLIQDQADKNRNDLPDIVDIVAEAAEYSREVLVDDLNYEDPMEGTGRKIMIILDDNDQYLSSGALGVTSLLSNGDPFVAIDPWLSEDYLQVTTGHEIFHTVQFGYGVDFAYTYSGINWAESTATWVEDIQYDQNNDYVNYLGDFFDHPDYSVFASIVPSGTLFEYGLNIWPRFLSEYYDNAMIRDIWEGYFDSDVSYESDLRLYETVVSMVEEEGDEFNEVFRQFTLWNLDLSRYEEGAMYPDVFMLEADAIADYQQIDEEVAPALYGTNYLYFENDGNDSSFYFHLQKLEGVNYAVTLVPYASGEFTLERSVSSVLGAYGTMNEPLELSGLAAKDGVVAVVSALDRDFSDSNELTTFDQAFLYNFLANFGDSGEDFSDLIDVEAVEDLDSVEQEGEVASSDEDVRLPDELILSVLSYDEDSVTLKWNRLVDEDIDSYELRYGTDNDDLSEVKSIAEAYTTSVTVTGLAEGETYTFELVGLDAEGDTVEGPSSAVMVTPQEWLFTDLSYLNAYYDEVSVLVEEGIFRGYDDGSFQPDADINRAELLKILVEGQGFTPGSEYKNCFTDVTTDWYAPYVCYAKDQDWISGYSDGSFRPGNTVSKVEALKMLFEVYEYSVEEGASEEELNYSDVNDNAWYAAYIETASELGILEEEPGTFFEPSAGRSRAEMALELYRYLVQMELIRI